MMAQQTKSDVLAPSLKLTTVSGQDAVHVIGRHGGTEVKVRLTDQSNEPLSGIMVMFTLPEQGASGGFADGSKRLIVHTNEAGEAVARGFSPNTVLGRFSVSVDASFQGLTAHTSVAQINVAGSKSAARGISSKMLTILVVAGGAATAGLIASTRKSEPAAAVPQPTFGPGITGTSVLAGTPSIGPP
jgi:hypothetical protein